MRFNRGFVGHCSGFLFLMAVLAGCNSAGSSGGGGSGSTSGTGTNTSPVATSNPTTPVTATNASTLLIWNGAGVNSVDLGCLLATLDQDGVPVQLISDTDLAGMTGPALAGYLALVFPDGSTSEALATLPSAVQKTLTDAVNTNGLHMVAFGGSSAIPGQLGLIPTSSSFWSEVLQITELVLDGLSIFFPQAAIISQFINGLPAIIQMLSGNGQVSLFAPQTSTPSCGTNQSTNPSGGTATVNPLETLIQLIKNATSASVRIPVTAPSATPAAA
jgi:hypothetical protein